MVKGSYHHIKTRLKHRHRCRWLWQRLMTALIVSGIGWSQWEWLPQVQAQSTNAYCHLAPEAIAAQEQLLSAALKGDGSAKQTYQTQLRQQAQQLAQCRAQTWPPIQAVWLRLYPCDIRQGTLDYVFDRIVSRGYNRVYLEVFGNGQVLLPPADNPTVWGSIVRAPGAEQVDLLAEAITKGRERGIKVYAWMFAMNFGYTYAQRSDRQNALARNGKGENTLSFVSDQSQAFIDPYNRQAQQDYYQLIQAVLRRRPDGVLFDYIRYPRGSGGQSVATKVQDLWIYGSAARQSLYDRSQNRKGRELIERYLSRGSISVNDVIALDQRYPHEGIPQWQGLPHSISQQQSAQVRQQRLSHSLWNLTVAHAAQGVIDFLNIAASPVLQQGISAGTVFFPEANQTVGRGGFDSRLQPWDRFAQNLEWHPMAYGVCGGTDCITAQVQRVVSQAAEQTPIMPVLAGVWGRAVDNRPSLEAQMQALKQFAPRIQAISHFSYEWQDPQLANQRKFCR